MAIATEELAVRVLNITAGTPIPVDFPLYEQDEVYVYYGEAALVAVYNTDYTVTLDEANYDTFIITPTASLLAKINALIALDPTEINAITIRRELAMLTSTTPASVRNTEFTSREFDRTVMRFQQLAEKLKRSVVLPPTYVGDAQLQLPAPEAGRALMWNSTADGLANGPTAAEIEGAEGFALQAQAASAQAALERAIAVEAALRAEAAAASTANIRAWGAKGDTVIGSGTVAAGSPNFVSDAGVFTASDVGKVLATQYGGTANAPITTTIVGYVSPTVVITANTFVTDASGPFYFGTDDTTNIQAAIDYATSNKMGLYIQSGLYLSRALNASSFFALSGSSPALAFIIWKNPTDQLIYRGAGNPYGAPYPAIYVKDVSFRGSFAANTSSGMVDVSFNYGGSPQRYAMFDNVGFNTLGLGFDCALRLNNASNYSTRDVLIAGYGPIRAGSRGVIITGDEKPIDMYNTGMKIYFVDYAVEATGQANFLDVLEGIVCIGCTFIVNNHCIDFRSATTTPYLHVSSSNLNGFISDIFMQNIAQYHITNNLFYSANRTPVEATHKAIEVANSFSGPVPYSASIISGNIFSGANTPLVPNVIGISINAFAGIDTGVVIGSNTFIDYDVAIVLFAGSNDVTVQDTNVYQNCAVTVQDLGVNNLVANAGFAATQGHEISNFGHHEAWGRVPLVLGAGSRVAVTFDVPMKNANYVVVCTHGAAASTEVGKPLCADSLTVNGFSLYVPGGTVGATLTINYHANGR